MESETESRLHEDPTVDAYLKSLNAKELKAYNIAKNHLGSTFDVAKSIGYRAFIKTL